MFFETEGNYNLRRKLDFFIFLKKIWISRRRVDSWQYFNDKCCENVNYI